MIEMLLRIMAQESFVFVRLGLLVLFLDRSFGSGRSRGGQRQQSTVSVVRCNVGWRI